MVYGNIDELPIYNYKKIYETKDLKFLLKDEKHKPKPGELEELWLDINIQIGETFGYSSTYKKLMALKFEHVELRFDRLITQDESITTLIKIKEKQIERIENDLDRKRVNFDEQISIVELYFKFKIDEKQTSVKRFFTYDKIMRDNVKR